jgi:hypothetical protein
MSRKVRKVEGNFRHKEIYLTFRPGSYAKELRRFAYSKKRTWVEFSDLAHFLKNYIGNDD